MRIMHLSDLHIGIRLYEVSLLEDQKYILDSIIDICKKQKVDVVIIAGDIYDKPLPPAEAVELFDDFITALYCEEIPIMVISGNHDSPRRLSFGSRIMDKRGVYIAGNFEGSIKKVTLKDKWGDVNFYMLPFVKPVNVRPYFEEKEIESYDDAIKCIIESTDINACERNVIIAHQFVTGAGKETERSESETIMVGGIDNVDVSVFEKFDYAALGHIHKCQSVGKNAMYCGTPLKYSFSEAVHNKYAVMVDIGEKGSIKIEKTELKPIRNMRIVEGYFKDIAENATDTDDYIYAVLKDEGLMDAQEKMRSIYPNTMRIDFGSKEFEKAFEQRDESFKSMSLPQLFERFYLRQNGVEPSGDIMAAVNEIYEDMEENK